MGRWSRLIDKVTNEVENGSLPTSHKVNDVDRDHRNISKILGRRNLKHKIIISKDRDKSSLWFSFPKNKG